MQAKERQELESFSVLKILEETRNDVREMRVEQKESLFAINETLRRLIELEGKQSFMQTTYDNISKKVEKLESVKEELEKRLDTLEKEAPMTRQVVAWFKKALWGTAILGVLMVINFLGIPLRPF